MVWGLGVKGLGFRFRIPNSTLIVPLWYPPRVPLRGPVKIPLGGPLWVQGFVRRRCPFFGDSYYGEIIRRMPRKCRFPSGSEFCKPKSP